MDYDRIIIELLNRISELEERVNALESSKPAAEAPQHGISKKYRFLADYLYGCGKSSVRLSFKEIEGILKAKLPSSAYNHRAFWANTTSHSIALSWMNVGYQTVDVDLVEQYIIFEKERSY